MYTQGKIPYQGLNYHVDDMLEIKAEIVAECQKMLW